MGYINRYIYTDYTPLVLNKKPKLLWFVILRWWVTTVNNGAYRIKADINYP